MLQSAKAIGLKTASEVFADRAYQNDGSLVPRSQPGAVIHDTEQAIDQVVQMVKEKTVTAITGEQVSIEVESICVHGDNEKALDFIDAIRKRLEAEDIRIQALGE
ncbi:LamB/YcsF/PxpA-like protein [Aduncisulcus paluster]|uniref:LamB/YcsF/PxpA-like protein n=1 Tax=Aduncisulcus paluster TaxID=2918883 RepID=A0ABQ5L0R7_9EUKA|nr:LamB/YcsF/PxpA-like protein [Aduncisulcus paluster]